MTFFAYVSLILVPLCLCSSMTGPAPSHSMLIGFGRYPSRNRECVETKKGLGAYFRSNLPSWKDYYASAKLVEKEKDFYNLLPNHWDYSVALHSKLLQVEVKSNFTSIENFLPALNLSCIAANPSILSATFHFTVENVVVKGHFKSEGTLLDKFIFGGEGDFKITFNAKCTFMPILNFNETKLTLEQSQSQTEDQSQDSYEGSDSAYGGEAYAARAAPRKNKAGKKGKGKGKFGGNFGILPYRQEHMFYCNVHTPHPFFPYEEEEDGETKQTIVSEFPGLVSNLKVATEGDSSPLPKTKWVEEYLTKRSESMLANTAVSVAATRKFRKEIEKYVGKALEKDSVFDMINYGY